MTSLARLLLVGALFLTAVAAGGASAQAPGAEADIRLLAAKLEEIHPDPFASVDRAHFQSVVNSAAARADELSENELLVELLRIVALPGTGNGHTGIFPGDPAHDRELHLYPLRLYEFPNGTFVVDEVGKRGLVGARVTAVGGVPYAEVAKRVSPLVPHDNEQNLKGYLPHFLLTAEVLDGLGIAEGLKPLEFTFTQGGKSRTVALAPMSASLYTSAFRDPLHGHYPSILPQRKPAPLYLRRGASQFWVGTLGGGRVVFVGFNAVRRVEIEQVDRITKLAKGPKVRRVIVDLRLNGGGDNTTYGYLLAALREKVVNRQGRLFVLIGRATFSAAANFAADLDRYSKATFVGEPTGGFVRGWGDTVAVPLPASGLTAHIAARYWDFRKATGDKRLGVNPDRKVNVTVSDFLKGRDPVLAAAAR
jgi:hypothetical protein